jgi:hypothetical protein
MMQTLTAPSAIDVGECSECAPADGIGAAAGKSRTSARAGWQV